MPVITAPPPELTAFVKRQIRDAANRSRDRRMEGRHFHVAAVVATPVDDEGRAVGDSFPLVTRDISARGVGLASVDPINAKRLSLRFTVAEEPVHIIADIVWTKDYGPFHLVGGKITGLARHVASTLPRVQPIQKAMEKQTAMANERWSANPAAVKPTTPTA